MQESSEIEYSLHKLPLLKQIAFGASCSERLLPNYLAFYEMERWGDFNKLRVVLDQIWAGLVHKSLLSELNGFSLEEIIQLAPDCDDFVTLFASLAGDAVASVTYTIEACRDQNKSIENIQLVLKVVENSIFQYLGAVNDPDVGVHSADSSFMESIFGYPLMVAEIEKQRQDLILLGRNEPMTEDIVAKLKSSSSKAGIQPIERGLVKVI